MESDGLSIIAVDPGCGYDGSAKVASHIFSNDFRIAEIGFGIDIEALLVLAVTSGFYFFKRRSDPVFQFIEKSRAERIAQKVVVKMPDMAPGAVITETTFGKETVDMRIPFEIPAKGVEDHDVAGSEIFGMVQIEKHACDHSGDGMKETVEEGTVLKEKVPEDFVNGKNAMAVLDIDEFESHTGGAFHRIFISAGRTEAAVTAERDKLQFTAVRAAVQSAAKGGIAAA